MFTCLNRSSNMVPSADSLVSEPSCDLPGNPEARKSTFTGWSRVFDKYSPSKETTLSPIKMTQANLMTVTEFDEKLIEIFTWTLGMSEQHFYDNAILLLSFSKNDQTKMAALLHRGCVPVALSFFHSLEDVYLLGKGAFGSVFGCRDPKTKLRFAIKQLSIINQKQYGHTRRLLNYMSERNTNIRAMDSPFVMKFYYSFQVDSTSDLLLFFEFCIGDLGGFIKAIGLEKPEQMSTMLVSHQKDIFSKIFAKSLNILEVCFIYIFEVFCGLDFLMNCNIIHQDVKPANIMIADNLHLKIGDFGLAYRTRTIHRHTNRLLVAADNIDVVESSNYKVKREGTRLYEDFELQLMWLRQESDALAKTVLTDKCFFDTPKISMADDVIEPTFLVDTWSAGVIAVQLLFRGFKMFELKHIDAAVLKDVHVSNNSMLVVHIVARKQIYTNFVYKGLVQAGTKDNEELMKFLASIFRPRSIRCYKYTKEKTMYHFSKILKVRYVDLDKIEKFKTFSSRKFNRSSINLVKISDRVRKVFRKREEPIFKNFKEFLDETMAQTRPYSVIKFDPGVTINFFS